MGHFFEKEWGSLRWLIIYLVSAVGSSMLSVIAMPLAVSVGSSGAVMGLFGAKLAEFVVRLCERKVTKQEQLSHEIRGEQCSAVTCSVVIVMLFSFIPYVDWAAHLGGLVAGFVISLAIFSLDVQSPIVKIGWLVVGLALSVVLFAYGLDYMYGGNVEVVEELRDVCGYYKQYFDDYECNCMREEYFNNRNGEGGNGSQD